MELAAFVDTKIADGAVSAEDILQVRRYIFGDGAISLEEGEALFRLNNADCTYAEGWYDLLPEAVCVLLVEQARPEGYVSDDHATWLINQITADGHVCTRTELDVVLKVLEKATEAPAALERFALEAVKQSALTGSGCTRAGHKLKPGVISDGEVELLRRILYASAGSASIAISKMEAEILFDINDATVEAENAPAWSELFAKAVANYLMALSGYQPPSREVALRRENWLEQPGGFEGGLGGFFKSMFTGGTGGVRSGLQREDSIAAQRGAAMSAEIAANEVVSEDEAHWLVNRIGRDGLMHENEKALLRFLREESPTIHPALQPLMERTF
ncbi:hypothetical protein JM93_00953 [Roseibium hamelinense]|uniref:Uncharacterized protein n=1 Tax=Roseibium hamelinense TaxID=150831 RepID=A0A562TJT3_9HYPH|nr:hypothetical protein [Roseibium hamelinense]MTI42750.1 hypothetical protein [Roseibium hamelinense]TWI93396.1 hypothetical protein JM93_00953 [Roseibium hamelinense]